jgi:hypothetical protein
MSQVYTPGLKASRRVRHRCRRFLPIPGDVLVEVGQAVSATDIVARTLLPGPVIPVNVAQRLSISAGDVARCMARQPGESIAASELLARSPGIFGWFPAECAAPASGTIESVSSVTGQVLIRGAPQAVELRAYLTGTVVESVPRQGLTVEADVTLVQGIFGIGGEAYGAVHVACQSPTDDLTADRITIDLSGSIAIGGARVTAEALARAVTIGVSAIVTGGIDDQDLRDFLGYDLGVATTGSEQKGLTLVITEGFGDIAMARQTFDLLASRAGEQAAVNGATQIRAGVVRPEVVIPWTGVTAQEGTASAEPGRLQMGATVRIIRDPYFGMIGTVSALPPEPRSLASGSKARVLEVRLDAGERVVVPRANVELVEQ